MSPKFWLIIGFPWCNTITEFSTKEELNRYLEDIGPEDMVSVEIISGFSLSKRTVSGQ